LNPCKIEASFTPANGAFSSALVAAHVLTSACFARTAEFISQIPERLEESKQKGDSKSSAAMDLSDDATSPDDARDHELVRLAKCFFDVQQYARCEHLLRAREKERAESKSAASAKQNKQSLFSKYGLPFFCRCSRRAV
jgi:hypothetical protein